MMRRRHLIVVCNSVFHQRQIAVLMLAPVLPVIQSRIYRPGSSLAEPSAPCFSRFFLDSRRGTAFATLEGRCCLTPFQPSVILGPMHGMHASLNCWVLVVCSRRRRRRCRRLGWSTGSQEPNLWAICAKRTDKEKDYSRSQMDGDSSITRDGMV